MVDAPDKRLDRARAELDTYGRVGKQTASDLILALFEAERQIAELRAERDALVLSTGKHVTVRSEYLARAVAAEAENARLRALPLKDEVERVLEEVRDNGLIYWEPNTARGQDRKTAVVERLDALISRLQARAQEGWQPIETAPKDGTAVWIAGDGFDGIGYCEAADWLHDEDRWYLKSFVSRKAVGQPLDDVCGTSRSVEPLYWMPLPAAPSEQGGDRS